MKNLEDLPIGTELKIFRMSEDDSRRAFGPFGDGIEIKFQSDPPPPWKTLKPKTWHSVIALLSQCGTCKETHEVAWFKGHGHTAEEALAESWKYMTKHFNS